MNIRILTIFTLAFALTASPLFAEEGRAIERRDMRIDRVEDKIEKMENRMEKQVKRGVVKANASSTIDIACAKTAIDVRGTALLTAFNTHSQTISALIASSTIGQKAAFDLTGTDRKKALRAVQQSMKMGRLQARKTMMEAEKNAFTTFKTSMKACGAKDMEIEKGEPLAQ